MCGDGSREMTRTDDDDDDDVALRVTELTAAGRVESFLSADRFLRDILFIFFLFVDFGSSLSPFPRALIIITINNK